MATTSVLTVHGWSAQDSSMQDVTGFLKQAGFRTMNYWLGGYPSMADEVHLADSARRMGAVIAQMVQDGELSKPFHIVTHSTGALVVRQWLAFFFPRGGAPVENFLMLAPANFGSPLAVMGRSALGRLIKGFRTGLQTGTEFLHALEHGSMAQENLALTDRLSPDGDRASPFSEAAVRPYVITGLDVFFPMGVKPESAWDGTVRAASANIDPHGVTVDFTRPDPATRLPHRKPWTRRGPQTTPFAVLPDRHHLNVIKPARARDGATLDTTRGAERLGLLILSALNVTDAAGYRTVRDSWVKLNEATRTLIQPEKEAERAALEADEPPEPDRFNEHYQIVFNVHDDTGLPVTDYQVWLTAPTDHELAKGLTGEVSRAEEYALRHVLKKVDVNKRASHRRVFHIDRRELLRARGLRSALTSSRNALLAAGIGAPAPGPHIRYFERTGSLGEGLIPLRGLVGKDPEERFLRRYATHFVEVIVPRHADDRVFTVKRA